MFVATILLFSTISASLVAAKPVELALESRQASDCQPVPVQPGSQYHCGTKGHTHPARPKSSHRLKSCTKDYLGCYIACYNDESCLSFSYNSVNNYCRLFTNTLDDLHFKEKDSSPIAFYDFSNCFAPLQCTPSCPGTVTPPPQCGNQGIQWAEYDNYQGNNNDPTYSNFDPTIYQSVSPNYQATTGAIGGINDDGGDQLSIYGSSQTFDSNYFALNHRGYFYPLITGTYNIELSSTDDAAFFWLGPNAYSGWTRENADVVSTYGVIDGQNIGHQPGQASGSFSLSAQEYYPFRILFAQAEGGAKFQVSITDPNGNVVVDSTSQPSDQVVQYSCDGTSAPAYPPFGSE